MSKITVLEKNINAEQIDSFKEEVENLYMDRDDLDYYNIDIDSKNMARNMFYKVLKIAVELNASDVHIEPHEDRNVIRVRIDGKLVDSGEMPTIDFDEYSPLITVIKLQSKMDITERRLPQDGRLDISLGTKKIDVRVSTMPTIFGEKIVLRILDRNKFLKSKKELGFSKKSISLIEKITNKSSGLILVTGPTGSGKTTTVYSLLEELKDKSKNIMTIENPVEYKMSGINQIQVNSKSGLGFENGLRSILRQDPDIIMVGEIRDLETAKIAIRAAITGHLVISTLHTNDSVSAIIRLMEMGIEPYLLGASLSGVISQKLVRKVCPSCSHEISIKDSLYDEIRTKVAVGCRKCDHKGYSGRTAVYEVLCVDDDIKKSVRESSDIDIIKSIAITNGMITFAECCRDLVERQVTTLEECISIEDIL